MKLHLKILTMIALISVERTVGEVTPWMILGLETGGVVRCRYEDMTDCSSVHGQDAGVSALAVSGEFVYVGLASGELRRCPLPHPTPVARSEPSNCSTFHQLESEVNALATFGKHIYAATTTGIVKCGLRKSEDCTKLYESDTTVYSLAVFGGRLYAGTYDSTISCSLDVSDDCSLAFNTTSTVNALSVSGKFVYVGLSEGSVQMCERDNVTECYTVFETGSAVRALDVFDQHIHTALESGEVLRYEFDTNETSSISNKSVVLSLTTVYDTTPIKKWYVGESADCVWQWSCPPFVIYYDVESRAALELRVKDNKLYTIKDELFDTAEADFSHSGSDAIFVMDQAGRIFASNQHPLLLLHHSSLMAGTPVAAAGEIRVKEGILESVSSCSGHYRPSVNLTRQVLSSLKRQGYERDVKVRGCGSRLLIDLDYKKTDLYYKAKYEKYSRKMKEVNEKGSRSYN